ncbi:MAG: DNA ligase [Deltaproteobacteria bacterium]|nr:DNA ligase [Deltaproteobacteria bacterium]
MTADFIRFPHTPHIAWLAPGRPRSDKVLDRHETRELLSDDIVVEEKVDGANVGISLSSDGQVRAQNRGHYIEPGGHPQFGPLWPWLAARTTALMTHVDHNLIIFGEWCFATHSVEYDALPDYFLGFDVYERDSSQFWSTSRRNYLFAQLAITAVPELFRGRSTLEKVIQLVETSNSRLTSGPLEGIYIRRESDENLLSRAKLVRAEFLQQIDVHWSQRPFRKNRLIKE